MQALFPDDNSRVPLSTQKEGSNLSLGINILLLKSMLAQLTIWGSSSFSIDYDDCINPFWCAIVVVRVWWKVLHMCDSMIDVIQISSVFGYVASVELSVDDGLRSKLNVFHSSS